MEMPSPNRTRRNLAILQSPLLRPSQTLPRLSMIGMISRVPAIRLAGGLLRLPATMPVGATRSLHSPIAIARTAKLCTKSTPAPAAEEVTGSLLAAVLTTFGTYCIADTLSNFIQHPRQKMDYGFLNQFIGREVDQSFWGTRTEHILGVAACLAVTDHASQALFSSYLGHPLCFASAPGVFIAHTFFFIFAGVAIYVAIDSAMNPTIAEKDRASEFGAGLYSTYIGSCTAWFEPFVGPVAVSMFGASFGNSWFGSALLPATLAYATVKGVGWYDWGNSGLNDLEKKINGLTK